MAVRPEPVKDRLWGSHARGPAEALHRVDKGAHRPDAAPAIDTAPRVPVQTPPRAGPQVALHIVG
jgi:hypothetical protein